MKFLADPGYVLERAHRSELVVTPSGTVAVVSSRWEGQGSYRGERFVDDQRCGQTWVRNGGDWQLLNEHCVQIAPAPQARPDYPVPLTHVPPYAPWRCRCAFSSLGGLVVGVLDILDAFVFFGLRGVPPIAIPQSIASGLLGRAAFRGGLPTAALGMLLHFGISFAVVSVYYAATRWLPVLARRPLVFGPLYGLVVYVVMNYVVLPLSAAVTGSGPKPAAVVVNGLLIHLLGVGLPSALFAAEGETSRRRRLTLTPAAA